MNNPTANPHQRDLVRFLPACLIMFSVTVCFSCSSVSSHQPDVAQGGRIVSIARPTQKPAEMLAASESGGLFRTVDTGVTFTHIDDLIPSRLNDVAYDPADASIILVTSREDFRAGADSGAIWRSIDGGRSWSVPSTAHPPGSVRCTDREAAYGISWQPNSTTVYIGVNCGIAISDDAGATWAFEVPSVSNNVNSSKTQDQFASVLAQADGHVIAAAGEGGVWVKDSRTNQWRASTGGGVNSSYHIHALTASPVNARHIFLAGGSSSGFSESVDGGNSWTAFPTSFVEGSRENFVMTTSICEGPFGYYLYFGTGRQLGRRRLDDFPGGVLSKGFEGDLHLEHVDPTEVLFDFDGHTPLVVSGDGGLMRSGDGGKNWMLFGGGKSGLNALQITDLTGQWIDGSSGTLQRLYYSTQDNFFYASPDDGVTWSNSFGSEGGHLQMEPRVSSLSDTHLVGLTCAACQNFISGDLFSNSGNWPNAPDIDGTVNDAVEGVPIRLDGGWYLQDTHSTDNSSLDIFRLSKTYGQSWEPGVALVYLSESVAGLPVIVRDNGKFRLYQALQRKAPVWSGPMFAQYGLARANVGSFVIERVDNGLGDLATIGGWGGIYPVLAVDASHPGSLLAVDLSTEQVKYSADSGDTWNVDDQITALVKQGGRFVFQLNGEPLVSAIGWDPYDSCHILLGTNQGGVFITEDGGRKWNHVPDSEQIPGVRKFYFPPTGNVHVASYGRGLWELAVNRGPFHCAPRVPPSVIASIASQLIDPNTGASMEKSGGTTFPPGCDDCTIIVSIEGTVAAIELEGPLLVRFALQAGNAFEFTVSGSERPLEVPNVTLSDIPRQSLPELFDRLKRANTQVRGLILRHGELKALVVGTRDLPFQPKTLPQIHVAASAKLDGMAIVSLDRTAKLYGSGFAPKTAVAIMIRNDARESALKEVMTNSRGMFTTDLPGTVAGARQNYVFATQQVGRQTLRTIARFLMESTDRQP